MIKSILDLDESKLKRIRIVFVGSPSRSCSRSIPRVLSLASAAASASQSRFRLHSCGQLWQSCHSQWRAYSACYKSKRTRLGLTNRLELAIPKLRSCCSHLTLRMQFETSEQGLLPLGMHCSGLPASVRFRSSQFLVCVAPHSTQLFRSCFEAC